MPINLVTNPSFASATTGWTAAGGTLSRVASAGAAGTGFGRVSSTSGATQLSMNCAIPLDGISGGFVSVRLSAKTSNITGQSLHVGVWFFNAAGQTLTPQASARQTLTTSWKTWLFEGIPVPAGAVSMRIEPLVVSSTGTVYVPPSTARTLDVDAVVVAPAATAPDYFDGGSAGAFWYAAANASRSGLMRPQLRGRSDVPCPEVEVVFDALPPTAVSVTLTRSAEGRSSPVAGAIAKAVAGTFVHTDFEVPMDVTSTYRAEMFDAAGMSMGFTLEGVVELAAPAKPNDDWLVVHNPLDPSSAVWVRLAPSGGATKTVTVDGAIAYPQGRSLGIVTSSGRRGMVAVAVDVATQTFEDGERFDALFGSAQQDRYPVLCVRVPKTLRRLRWPAMWMAGILSATADTNYWSDRLVWRSTAQEVERPVPNLVIPLLRRKDVDAYYASRQAMNADNASRFSLSRRYDLAGFGG